MKDTEYDAVDDMPSVKNKAFSTIPEHLKKYFRPSTTGDADYVAEHMSDISRQEINLYFPKTPQEACYKGLALSDLCLTIIDPDSGEIFGMGGLANGMDIWMLLCHGALDNRNIRRLLMREARPFLNWLLYDSGLVEHGVENYTSPEYEKQLRWLKWLGAKTMVVELGNGVKSAVFMFNKEN